MPKQMLQAALKKYFGFDDFRPGQLDAMHNVMGGQDSLIVMPTGAGKSLCFQLPALLYDGTTLVISPLIALMKDQVDGLQQKSLPVTYINSSLDNSEIAARLDGLRTGQWKLCYVAPERLRNQRFRESLRGAQVSLLAVDEAHCISQWGHDFRPDYRAIGEFAEHIGRPSIVALTATATPQVQEDIEQQLGLQSPYRLVTGFNRPNLRFDVRFTPGDSLKQETLKAFLDEQPANACGVIYVGRRRDADDVANFVRTVCRRTAVSYHGGMLSWERDQLQDEWMSDSASIVVATNAFGMGVDKPDVRFVVHYTMPGSLEGYYQEAGRAGRDSNTSHCMLLYDPSDVRLHEWFIDNSAPTLEDLRSLFVTVNRLARRKNGRLSTTMAYLTTMLDWRGDSKVRIGMRLLEDVGLVESLGEQNGYSHWQLVEVRGRVDMQTPMHKVEEQRELKRQLLQKMIDYSQTYDCRRQYLLDYFGDATAPIAEWCCDNCRRQENKIQLKAASSPEEQAILSILDAVSHLSYGVGRTLLAKILTGSRAKGMARYFEHPQFSALGYMKRKAVQQFIDELIRKRYLQLSSGKYPTLSLTPDAEQAVTQRLGIPLGQEVKPSSALAMKRLSSKRVTDTVAETQELLEEGLGAQEIADLRGLRVSTIFNHLAALIEQGKISVEQVVDEDERALIEAAVRDVGSFYLSPIKARLPEEISYGEIRCVVAAMQHAGDSPNESVPKEELLFEGLVEWRRKRAGNQRSYLILSNTVLHAIAEAMPSSMTELEAVRGVNSFKCQRYGAEILAVVAEVTGKSVIKESRESYTTNDSAESDNDGVDSLPKTEATPSQTLDETETLILDQLRQWRSETAKEAGIPAYIVFNNATLDAIVAQRPSTVEQLLKVPGIGQAKSERYGEAVLEIVGEMAD
ncbi:MAG: RecQ family ATP-dependent DNA helicase [Ardenticatenaceae bacterium]